MSLDLISDSKKEIIKDSRETYNWAECNAEKVVTSAALVMAISPHFILNCLYNGWPYFAAATVFGGVSHWRKIDNGVLVSVIVIGTTVISTTACEVTSEILKDWSSMGWKDILPGASISFIAGILGYVKLGMIANPCVQYIFNESQKDYEDGVRAVVGLAIAGVLGYLASKKETVRKVSAVSLGVMHCTVVLYGNILWSLGSCCKSIVSENCCKSHVKVREVGKWQVSEKAVAR